jgi:UrcA family protein
MNVQSSLRRPSSRAVLAAVCIALSAVAPLVAYADSPAATPPRTLESKVSLSDLDLSTPEGVRAAHKRLRQKAAYLCRQLGDSVRTTYRWTHAACVQATLADAIQRLNVPALVASDRLQAQP